MVINLRHYLWTDFFSDWFWLSIFNNCGSKCESLQHNYKFMVWVFTTILQKKRKTNLYYSKFVPSWDLVISYLTKLANQNCCNFTELDLIFVKSPPKQRKRDSLNFVRSLLRCGPVTVIWNNFSGKWGRPLVAV